LCLHFKDGQGTWWADEVEGEARARGAGPPEGSGPSGCISVW